MGFVAWLVLIPLRELAETHPGVLSVGMESTAALVVVGSIYGVALSMPPLKFMDGHKVFGWSRVAWGGLALAAAFAFTTVAMFQDSSGFEAMGKHGTIAILAAVAVCAGLSACTWGLFYLRRGGRTPTAVPAPILNTTGTDPKTD